MKHKFSERKLNGGGKEIRKCEVVQTINKKEADVCLRKVKEKQTKRLKSRWTSRMTGEMKNARGEGSY